MVSSETIYQLDETTFYSVLGLKYGASEVQIRKAYMKLARELHPDKSKSDEAAELFKKVAHAHFILTDKKEKMQYDSKILAKGLYDYTPRMKKSGRTGLNDGTYLHSKKSSLDAEVKQKPRKSRPYEEQPYGFGVENNKHSNKNIPLFKTFSAKSYQNSKKATTPPRAKQPQETNPFNKRSSESARDKLKEATASSSSSSRASSDESDIKMKSKMARMEERIPNRGTHAKAPDSPFQDSTRRHFARTKYVSSKSTRRSLSPVKNTPNSSTETLHNVKHIFNSMSDRLKNTLFGSDPQQPEKISSERKIMSDEEIEDFLRKNVESEPREPDRQNLSSSINLNTDNFDEKEKEVFQARNQTTELDIDDHLGTNFDILDNVNEKEKESPDEIAIGLEELEVNLPNNKESFDMRNVSDSLDKYKVKRMKRSLDIADTKPPNSSYTSSENLQEPVNIPLPRIYKPDPIPLQDFNIDLSISNIKLPEIPNLQCNVLDRSQVLQCQRRMLQFNKETNDTKRKLLLILSQRFTADENLQDRMIRVENVNNLVHAKSYDIDVVTKLNELQNRQRIVAENHANLMNTVYASGLLENKYK